MRTKKTKLNSFCCAVGLSILTVLPVAAANVDKVTVFACGAAVNATAPDAITIAKDTLWVSYTNGADSTGLKGSSTIVEYSFDGKVLKTYSINGSVDGLKFNPETNIIWALQNQDGNSTLTLISLEEGILPGSPFSYAVKSSTRGKDDVAFLNGKAYLSYTNPTSPEDVTIQVVDKHTNPIQVDSVLEGDAKGTNLATGATDQPTAQTDPDSLSTTPFGGLMLTSGADGQLIFVQNPRRWARSVSFLQVVDAMGAPVSGLDDAVWVLTPKGTFYISDTANNRVLKVEASNLSPVSLYASVGSLNVVGNVNLETGVVTPFLTDVNAPHGMVFVPDFESLF